MREIPSLRSKRLSAAAMAALRRYPFPGNVREMKNIIERAAYRESGDEISAADLGLPAPSEASSNSGGTFADRVAAFERSLILGALDESNGNQAAAARSLGLTYHQYRYYLRKFSP